MTSDGGYEADPNRSGGHDCGHLCCDERQDPMHDHFLEPDVCPTCVHRHDGLCVRPGCGRPPAEHEMGGVFCP